MGSPVLQSRYYRIVRSASLTQLIIAGRRAAVSFYSRRYERNHVGSAIPSAGTFAAQVRALDEERTARKREREK